MAYLTPETINAALAARPVTNYVDLLALLDCTISPVPVDAGETHRWNVYTADAVLVFTGTIDKLTAWLRNSDPACTFAELSPMRRDRLVAAFVSPGRDLLKSHQNFAAAQGCEGDYDMEIIEGIWSFARHAGWSYLQTLESPASVATEALSLWSSQSDNDERDDPGAYE